MRDRICQRPPGGIAPMPRCPFAIGLAAFLATGTALFLAAG